MISKENIHINKFQRVSKMIPKVPRMQKEITSNETTYPPSIVHGFTCKTFDLNPFGCNVSKNKQIWCQVYVTK